MAALLKLFLFVFVYLVASNKVPMDEIRTAFKEMDTDGNGEVTLEEITEHMKMKKTVPDADYETIAQSIYEFYDKNQDGVIKLEEFLPKHDEL